MEVLATANLAHRECVSCKLPKAADQYTSAAGRKCRQCRDSVKREKQRRKDRRPARRYKQHRHHAAARGIPFLLTFDQWWQVWAPHWSRRGYGAGRYCMARHGDTGPYAPGNVSIISNAQNTREYNDRQRAA
jgi:hypothetical protein